MSTSATPDTAATATVSLRPIRLGHAVIKVKDLEAAERFYIDLLGFELANKYPSMFFFRLGGDHHTLAVLQVGEDAAPPVENQVGLYHLAFQVESLEALRGVYRLLKEHHVPIRRTTTHTMSTVSTSAIPMVTRSSSTPTGIPAKTGPARPGKARTNR